LFRNKSVEKYLLAIFALRKQRGYARCIDIAKYMDVTRASVSTATKQLQADKYVDIDDCRFIKLTPSGEEIAQRVYRKFAFFTSVLSSSGVDAEKAEKEACELALDLCDESFEKLKLRWMSRTGEQT